MNKTLFQRRIESMEIAPKNAEKAIAEIVDDWGAFYCDFETVTAILVKYGYVSKEDVIRA